MVSPLPPLFLSHTALSVDQCATRIAFQAISAVCTADVASRQSAEVIEGSRHAVENIVVHNDLLSYIEARHGSVCA